MSTLRLSATTDPFTLSGRTVHVWQVWLDREQLESDALGETLSTRERERAARFRLQIDRDRYIVAHAWLRRLLSGYLEVDPQAVRLTADAHGKPCVAGESGPDAVRFSMAHSSSLALYAVTRGREIGVDVEQDRAVVWHEDVARRFLSPADVARLTALPREARDHAFLTSWVRKEAYLKALGSGFSTDKGHPDPRRWTIRTFAPRPGYIAAFAIERRNWRRRRWCGLTPRSSPRNHGHQFPVTLYAS